MELKIERIGSLQEFCRVAKIRNLQNFAGCKIFATCSYVLFDPIFLPPFCNFFLNYPLCIFGSSDIFCNFPCSEQYIRLSQGFVQGITGCNKFWRESFQLPRLFSFLSFSLIFSHFLACQTPPENDNSEDGWLNPFYP